MEWVNLIQAWAMPGFSFWVQARFGLGSLGQEKKFKNFAILE
jgi:hypothetical protein